MEMGSYVRLLSFRFSLWCRRGAASTKQPNLVQTCEFAAGEGKGEGVHRANPNQWLEYNLSRSFNRDRASPGEIQYV
jgi:isocitrate lyase